MTQPSAPAASELEFSDIDLKFGRFMARLAGAESPALEAAAALASRATGNGDVCVQLSAFAEKALAPLDVTAPALSAWVESLRTCGVVGSPGELRPLILDERARLYLYRYWEYEKRLGEHVLQRAVDAGD